MKKILVLTYVMMIATTVSAQAMLPRSSQLTDEGNTTIQAGGEVYLPLIENTYYFGAGNPGERAALMALYNHTNGAAGAITADGVQTPCTVTGMASLVTRMSM